MKIAYVDIVLDGHHENYLKSLAQENKNSILIIPNEIQGLTNKQYIIESELLYKHPLKYIKWIYKIRKILNEESVDIVHFLYGDVFYRYFGIGLNKIKGIKIVATFHQIRRSIIKDISLKCIFRKIHKGIIHTDSLKEDLEKMRISNMYKIEYPQFNDLMNINTMQAKEKLKLPLNVPIIAAIGGTREDKGLDILIEALKNVHSDFHLLIAGQEISFDKTYISNHTDKYKKSVTTMLKYLTDEELENCLVASDIIILPYRKKFDGASGPLGEGVWLRKKIIGPNHGSLGKIINDNKIGITFETEKVSDLSRAIEECLNSEFIWSKEAENYRKKLDKDSFIYEYKKIYTDF